MAYMTEPERERQRRVDAIREQVSVAAAGICLGASFTLLIPSAVMRSAGFDDAIQTVAAEVAYFAALVWLAARASIAVRWK